MDYSEFHTSKILETRHYSPERQAELFAVIDAGTDKLLAENAFAKKPRPKNINEGVYDHLKCYQTFASEDALTAHAEIVNSNMRLVKYVVGRYRNGLKYIEADDLMQSGWATLALSAWKYDPAKGAKFSSFAIKSLEYSVQRAVEIYDNRVRIPAHTVGAQRRVRNIQPELGGEDYEDRQISIIEAAGGWSLARRVNQAERFRHIRSLDESFGRPYVEYFDLDGQPSKRGAFNDISNQLITNAHEEMEEEVLWAQDTVQRVEKLTSGLSKRERFVVEMRSGMLDGEAYTLEEVGVAMGGLSRERVRQIESKAHSRMRWELMTAELTEQERRKAQEQEAMSPVDKERARAVLLAKQARYHEWGRFLEAVALYGDEEVSHDVLAIAREKYFNPDQKRQDVWPPDVRDDGIASSLIQDAVFSSMGDSLVVSKYAEWVFLQYKSFADAVRAEQDEKENERLRNDLNSCARTFAEAHARGYRWGIEGGELKDAIEAVYGQTMREGIFPDMTRTETIKDLLDHILRPKFGEKTPEAVEHTVRLYHEARNPKRRKTIA